MPSRKAATPTYFNHFFNFVCIVFFIIDTYALNQNIYILVCIIMCMEDPDEIRECCEEMEELRNKYNTYIFKAAYRLWERENAI